MSDLHHEWYPGSTGEPVLVLLHGTGGGPRDLLPVARELNPSAPVLAPAGPVSENGAARWFRRLAEGVFDSEDVVRRTHELAEFLHRARERYELDGRRMVAVGFSNGANIASALTLLRPDVLSEAAMFSSVLPAEQLPKHDLRGTRIALSNGQHDPMAPVDAAGGLVTALRERGAVVTEHWHPGGHQITREGVQRVAQWLAQRDG